MKLIASATIKMKKNILPQFIATLYKYNMDVNTINLTESDSKWDEYAIDIVYSAKKDIVRLVDTLKKNVELFKEVVVTSTFEDKIEGGILITSSKIEIENINDIQTALIGGNKLIHEKIESNLQKNYCASFNSIALIGGVKISDETDDRFFYHMYADCERDSAIIKRFTGKNSFPIIIKYHTIEDMIKIIKGIEENFCCLRILNNDEDDYLLANIIDSVTKPLIFRELDENPVFYLSLINTISKKNNIVPSETSVGIIGLTNSTIRLTSLLGQSGYMKVLGYDSNERRMMSFENRRGLATTIENVISNSDILMIMDEKISYDYINSFRAGQIIISGIADDFADAKSLEKKGVRELIKIEDSGCLSILPSLLNVFIDSTEKRFNDNMLINIAECISKHLDNQYDFPNLFNNLNLGVEDFILK
ncbi:MAG: hypothetical protein FWH53_10180, partial [Leptospirales bacterium]|nr:hypothetical protein [Leptospirales bacterium]